MKTIFFFAEELVTASIGRATIITRGTVRSSVAAVFSYRDFPKSYFIELFIRLYII